MPTDRWITLPNLFTYLRLALVPVVSWFLIRADYRPALVAFLVAAASDGVDGFLARRLNQISVVGATLDPIADKLMLFVVTVLLAWNGAIPVWLASAIVARDAVILTGAAAYRKLKGHLEIMPTLLGKANTLLEFGVLGLAMAQAAQWLSVPGLAILFWIAFASTVISGMQYVWIWGRKAAAHDAA
jgi:cardiolipin synthase